MKTSFEKGQWQPMSKLPPPSKRLKCAGCGKTRKPYIIRESRTVQELAAVKTRRKNAVEWKYHGYGHFCTMTCATRYANRIVDDRISRS